MGFWDKISAPIKVTKEYFDEGKGVTSRNDNYRERALQDEVSNHGWYICPKCGGKFRKSDMEADHIIPHSKGGDNSRGNLQLICRHCNRSKGASTSDTKKDLRRKQSELAQDKIDFLGTAIGALFDELSKKK